MWLLRLVTGVLATLGVLIALAPEPAPKPIKGLVPRIIAGQPGELALADVADRDRNVPTSIAMDREYRLVRSWTPERGVQPLVVEFGPLPHAPYLGVIYQGTIDDPEESNDLYLRCSNDPGIKPVSTGGVNTTVTETIVKLDPTWCADGQIHLRMVGGGVRNIGVAAPYQRSGVAYLKQSHLGYAGFYLIAFGVLAAVFFSGGLAARRFGRGLSPVIGGLLAIGAASLTAFYVYAWTPIPAPLGLAAPLIFGAAVAGAWRRAPALTASVWRAQKGVLSAWFVVGLLAMTILHLASVGAGAWEPAYRFSPAVWSSDHTLPMVLAEVARLGILPQEGMVGGWSLSDRPPLLAGTYLLFADTLQLLQANNDGPHLQPIALGVGGIAACSLWAATVYWAVRQIAGLGPRVATLAVTVVAVTPFALFNTAYTWPKLFGAAFSLAAAAYVFRPRGRTTAGEACAFGTLAGFALLSHAASAFFLAPVSLIYFISRLWKSPKALAMGAGAGLALLATWSAFKLLVLPSHDPLLAYALTGHMTFEAAPLLNILAERYGDLEFSQWLRTKIEVGSYLFTPSPPHGPLPLERPPAMPAGGLPARLRFWDFYALSAGNLPLIVLGLMGLVGAVAPPASGRRKMAGRLLLAALGCYGLFVAATFIPLYIHQFSYDAILAMALAGLVATASLPRGRQSLVWLAAIGGVYTTAVWVVAPLAQARFVDVAALAVLVLLLAILALVGWRAIPSPGRQSLAAAVITLTSIAGLLLLWRPTALIIEQEPSDMPATSSGPPACIGAFDQVVRRKNGAWRAYGWAWDLSTNAPAGSVRVLDGAGASLGIATTGVERPDVAAAIPAVTTTKTGWWLDVAGRPGQMRAIAILAGGAECELGQAAP